MKVTVSLLLMIVALLFIVAHAMGKAPLWPAVLCVVLERLCALLPLS
jgi:hypothetical protein